MLPRQRVKMLRLNATGKESVQRLGPRRMKPEPSQIQDQEPFMKIAPWLRKALSERWMAIGGAPLMLSHRRDALAGVVSTLVNKGKHV